MYDSYLVVKDTLKNDVIDGKAVGFRFGVRLSNYRGNALSLVHGFYVEVDGVLYTRDQQFLEVNGKVPRSMDELATCYFEQWAMQDTAYLHIAKEGGLAPGRHTIRYMQCTLAAYGYNPTDEEWVRHPPEPGHPMCGGKTSHINSYELELKEA